MSNLDLNAIKERLEKLYGFADPDEQWAQDVKALLAEVERQRGINDVLMEALDKIKESMK